MNGMFVSVLALVLALGGAAEAQQSAPLSAQDSDPRAMAWMQGSPPPADRVIRLSDVDYFGFPKLRWTVCHVRQLMPNVAVDNGISGARPLSSELDASIDDVSFMPLGTQDAMTWREAFDANYTDGVIVLHHGRIVYERYGGCLAQNTLHAAMSVTKSLTGLLAEILVAEGTLDQTAPVRELIPELKGSAFGDATVRQVMDMTTALDYSEEHADPKAEVWAYAQTVKKQGRHGEGFAYKTINSDTLGWLIARVTGHSVADELSERVWSRMGAEREAFYTVDSIGTPFAGGGLNATLRDMARFGQLMLDQGRVGGEQIVPSVVIDRIRHGGDPDKFEAAGYTLLPNWRYSSMWWISNDNHGVYAARGVHGQTIWIDPKADMVIVRFASHPVAANAANDPTSIPAFRALAGHLMATDTMPLLGQEWVIEDIAGRGLMDGSHVTLQFLADGRLAGSAGCNRIVGSYVSQEGQLAIEPVGATMMVCPEALMSQERTLLELLPKIQSYRIDDTGALVLSTRDQMMIVARR